MPPPSQDQNEIKIKTPLGKDVVLLQGFTITEELGRLFAINVELASTKYINFEDLLGENVTICLGLTEGERFFNGHVSSISQGVNEGGYARYSATIHPWLWFLTRTADCRIFQNKTIPGIVKEVCNELGFTDIEDKLISSYPAREYVVQYRETDFSFISRLMEEEGCYYYFTHQLGSHTLVLADDLASHELDLGGIPYYPPNDTAVRDEEYISDWFFRKKIQPGTYTLNDYDPLRPQANLHESSTVVRTHSEATHEYYDYPGEYDNRSEGEAYANKRIQEVHVQYEEGHGRGIARELSCGCLFSLTNFPREDQNRQYLVVLATHSIYIADFESDRSSVGGMAYSNDFGVIESGTPYRPQRITPKPIIQGPQTAFVVGPEGEEIYTDEHARVKVQFHWDRLGTNDDNSSCFIRVAEYMAGKKWGSIYIPRIGQEVIVEFLEGDPDRPIITGRVYNGEHMPPYDLPANKTQSGYKSRSSKEGNTANFNEIRMEDKKGQEQLYIHAEKNEKIVVENNKNETVGYNESITIGHDRDEIVRNDETLTVKNNRTRTVENKEVVTVEGLRFHNVYLNEMINVGLAQEIQVGAFQTLNVGGYQMINVLGYQDFNVDGYQKMSIGDDYTLNIGKNRISTINTDDTLDVGSKLSYTIGSEVEIINGSSKITMNSSGKIEISGTDITLQAGAGKINIDAGGIITIKGPMVKINT